MMESQFDQATHYLGQRLKGKHVRIEFLNGEIPGGYPIQGATRSGVSIVETCELLQVYRDAILVRYHDNDERLIFLHAIRAISEDIGAE